MLISNKNKILILFLVVLFTSRAFSQTGHHGHHATKKTTHRTKVVTHKQYGQVDDSAKFSTEFIVANYNTWTGESYGYAPSIQTLITHDNNRNFEYGIFGCFNAIGTNKGLSNGLDLFMVLKLTPRISFLADAYTFFNNKDTLINDYGYTSKIYNLYSSNLKFDFGTQNEISFILGYSAFNNTDSLQQSASIEVDFNFTKSLTLVFAYSTGSRIFDARESAIASGFGIQGEIKNKFKYAFSYNPSFYPNVPSFYTPYMVMVSVDLSKEVRKQRKR